MTTNAIELQQYVNSIGAKPWYEKTGMLGMGLFGSFVISMILFLLILYAFGVLRQYRKEKTWLIPNGRYWMEIGRGAGIVIKAWSGIATPRAFIDRNDGVYAKLTFAQIEEALDHARVKMRAAGMTLEFYSRRAFDCENYAMAMISFASHYAAERFKIVNAGIPLYMFGYTREDGKKHVIIRALTGSGVSVYFEPYPEEKYSEEKTLTKREIASVDLDFG